MVLIFGEIFLLIGLITLSKGIEYLIDFDPNAITNRYTIAAVTDAEGGSVTQRVPARPSLFWILGYDLLRFLRFSTNLLVFLIAFTIFVVSV